MDKLTRSIFIVHVLIYYLTIASHHIGKVIEIQLSTAQRNDAEWLI